MSSCLLFQEHNRIFIGADTAVSICVNDKFYRYSNNAKKIFKIGNDLLFCSGSVEVVNKVVDYLDKTFTHSHIDVKIISDYLITYYPYNNNKFFDIEVILCQIINGKSTVYQISQYNNYMPISSVVETGNINVICAGIETEKSLYLASKNLELNLPIDDIYKQVFSSISNEKTGGELLVYEFDNDMCSLRFKRDIKENTYNHYNNIQPHKLQRYLLVADAMVGRLIMGQNLNIINSSGNFTIDNNGFKATNGIYSVGINPNTPSEIFNIKVNGTNQLYVDTVKKKLVYKGDLESVGGTFSGNLSAAGGTFTGTLSGVDGTFTGKISASQISAGGTLSGVIVQQVSNAGKVSATLSQDTIGGRLNIYDSDGNLNVQIGVENGSGGNIGGTLILCNDGDTRKRAALAIDKINDRGVLELYKSNGLLGTQLTAISGMINGYDIITDENIDRMSVDYANRSGYASSASSAGGLVGVGTNVTLYSNTLRPDRDNSLMLGSPSYRWTTVYASSSTISTSDKKKKKDIAPMTDKQLEFFKLIMPVTYQFIDGTSGRTHYGFVSQDIEIAMQKCGLTSLDFAGFVKSPRYLKTDEITGEYDISSEIIGYDYFLRYEEFIALNTYIIQQQQSKIEEIEHRLILLENI